ncbi:hypothetical protein GCM10009681_06360 [Luedemannella helvata]|uniref:Uncharacterized protein n=1 Tax=Luedemannella helvata TaxID=349315 RepID=A0ABN2JTA0_9ACTN
MHIDATRDHDLPAHIDDPDIARGVNAPDLFDATRIDEHVSRLDAILCDYRSTGEHESLRHTSPSQRGG